MEEKPQPFDEAVPAGDPELERPTFLSVPEAARICGVSRNTVYAWVRKDKLAAYQTPGRTNLIRPTDLVRFMHQNGMFVPPELSELARKDDKQNPADAVVEGEGTGLTVLVADDDPINRSLCVRAIHDQCVAYQAETGYEALHLLTVHPEISVVLLDMRMPGLHGSETLAEIEQIRPDVGVIIVTGYEDDIPEASRQSPVVRQVIQKPYTIPAIRAAVCSPAASSETEGGTSSTTD